MNILVAIPVFNEEAYLADVLREVRRYADQILVVDDGSTDWTARILDGQPSLFRIRHLENRGYGQSLIDAFSFAVRHGYDWLITMDCDRQHEPASIPAFVQAAARDNVDIISGSRYLSPEPGDSQPPPARREINRFITDLLNDTLRLNITDAFCGFKAYRVRSLKRLNITVPGYAMPLQFWVQVARIGLRVSEVPVKLIYHDPERCFGGLLDDPNVRLVHYLEVFARELAGSLAATAAQIRPRPGRCIRPGDRAACEPC